MKIVGKIVGKIVNNHNELYVCIKLISLLFLVSVK